MAKNIYGKGARKKATELHSLIVRERAGFVCENCGRKRHPPGLTKEEKKVAETGQIQCAHIISRNYGATRTDEKNAFALCAKCHWRFGKWPMEFARFVFAKIGEEEYDRLAAKAMAGTGTKIDWVAELERLQEIRAAQLG